EYKITPCSVGQILVPCLKNIRDLALGALALYILIWCTVSYIGVQVTYVLGPIILMFGLIAYFTAPSEKLIDKE
uniref:hypothetical protein n=1 Tax=Aeromonas caviae TaxID=648 RepID=UPI003F74307A